MTFGRWCDETTAHAIMGRAFEAGINFFDTANIYSDGISEEIVGSWLRGKDRHQVVIATKVRGRMWEGPDGEGLSSAHVVKACEGSLRRLGTDTIDLYQVHWPDESTPLDETMRALNDLIQQGKVRAIGCSNHPASLLAQALEVSGENGLARYESLQPHYNLVHRLEFEAELAELCVESELGVIPYSPLAGGFLTGKYRRGEPIPVNSRAQSSRSLQRYMTDANFALVDTLDALGRLRGKSVAQMALGWLLTQPVITAPIIGARTIAQLEESLGAVGLRLSADEMATLSEASA
jgi:aryl-alcohol dehydrogenase-like predicted oxidoreductase